MLCSQHLRLTGRWPQLVCGHSRPRQRRGLRIRLTRCCCGLRAPPVSLRGRRAQFSGGAIESRCSDASDHSRVLTAARGLAKCAGTPLRSHQCLSLSVHSHIRGHGPLVRRRAESHPGTRVTRWETGMALHSGTHGGRCVGRSGGDFGSFKLLLSSNLSSAATALRSSGATERTCEPCCVDPSAAVPASSPVEHARGGKHSSCNCQDQGERTQNRRKGLACAHTERSHPHTSRTPTL